MKGYGQFCPVAKAAEILSQRWTLLVIRELLCGSTRFNDLRRGLPLMSSSLLSQRLKLLEQVGIVERRPYAGGQHGSYVLTPAGEELHAIVMSFGEWGQRWARSRIEENDLDAGLLMWDIRRTLSPEAFPPRRNTLQFEFSGQTHRDRLWWIVVSEGVVDLCYTDPGFLVDLYVSTDLHTMTQLWMGDIVLREARARNLIDLQGDRELVRRFGKWFARSLFATVKRPVHRPIASPCSAGVRDAVA